MIFLMISSQVSKAAARCDDTIALLYTCDPLPFLCHAACASNFMTYLRGKASVTPDLLELAVDCLALHRRITGLTEASARSVCCCAPSELAFGSCCSFGRGHVDPFSLFVYAHACVSVCVHANCSSLPYTFCYGCLG